MEQIKVLIADDHALLRQGLRHLLELEKDIAVVGEASNGLEAEQLYPQLSPDVVLMDLAMPIVDGVEATRVILRHYPAAKVLALTMIDEDKKVVDAILAGVRGYLIKDCTATDLVQAVRAVHRNQGYFSPSVAAVISDKLRHPTEKERGKMPLTDAEIRILSLLAMGMSNDEIAHHLSLSPKTVRNRISLIFAKLNLKNRTQAALFALKEGIISLNQHLPS